MNKFAEKLKELREEKELSISSLAKKIGFSRAAINHWENKKREPSISTLVILAKYFAVSTDYLLGLEDY